MASKGCKSSPNLSKERGWIWYSIFGLLCLSCEKAQHPS